MQSELPSTAIASTNASSCTASRRRCSLYSSIGAGHIRPGRRRASRHTVLGEIRLRRVDRALQEPHFDGTLDRLAARGSAQLAVDRDRFGLDGVAREEQPARDLRERQMGGEVGKQPAAPRPSGSSPRRRPARRSPPRARAAPARPRRDAQVRPKLEHPLGLCENRAGGGDLGEREMGARELEPDLDGQPRDAVVEHRPQAVGACQRRAGILRSSLVQRDACRRHVRDRARRVVAEAGLIDDAPAAARARCPASPQAPCLAARSASCACAR